MATGGNASGRETSASIRMRPGTRRLTTSQLTASATGTLISVATIATCSVSRIGSRSTASQRSHSSYDGNGSRGRKGPQTLAFTPSLCPVRLLGRPEAVPLEDLSGRW